MLVYSPYHFAGRAKAATWRPLFLRARVVRTNFYIDGFNLYYRAVKGTPYRWLDLFKICQALAPSHTVNRIRYFTALVIPRTADPNSQRRQRIYIRALETIPCLSVHYGQFRERKKYKPLASSLEGSTQFVEILDSEEKGTDVNLATYLLIDGFEEDYEQAIVVSNDSDLALPIKLVRKRLNLPVWIVNPNRNQKAPTPKELADAATFQRRLRETTLRNCQFPAELSDEVGTITRPSAWDP